MDKPLGERCRFTGCEHDADVYGIVPVSLLKFLEGSGDAGKVPLCEPHAEMLRTARNGCDAERCRFPFGSHAQTCEAYVPYRQADG